MATQQITASPAAAPLTAPVATNQVFPLATFPLLAAVLTAPGTKRLEGRKFTVRSAGVCTSVGAATTFAPFLAVGNSPAIASDTIIAQTAPVTVNATSCPWYLEAHLIFDSTSGKLHGNFSSCVNNALGALAAISTVVTGLNGMTEPVFSMVAGGQFSAGATGNIITLTEFVLEE